MFFVLALSALVVALWLEPSQPAVESDAIQVVVASLLPAGLQPDGLRVEPDDLEATPNTAGEGVIVYHPQTRFGGAERHLLWIVLEGQAYPLNSPSMLVSDRLRWPRDAGDSWDATGLDRYAPAAPVLAMLGRSASSSPPAGDMPAASAAPGPVGARDLQAGHTYVIADGAPLMPGRTLEEAGGRQMQSLPAGTVIAVQEVDQVRNAPWYRVVVSGGPLNGQTGWINSTALVGQTIQRVE